MSSSRWVVVDVETTGFSPSRDRIIEIGAIAGEGKQIVDEFHALVDPERPIPLQAQKIHGITDAMLRGQPKPQDVLPELHRFIGRSTLIGHNIAFDAAFLQAEFARCGLNLSLPRHCTLQLSRRLLPHLPNHRLETVARHLLGEISVGVRLHRALDDARLTAQVWMAMRGRGDEGGLGLAQSGHTGPSQHDEI